MKRKHFLTSLQNDIASFDDDLVNWEIPENRLIFAVILQAVSDCRPSMQARIGKKCSDHLEVAWVQYVMRRQFLDEYFENDVRDLCDQIAYDGKESELYNQIMRAKEKACNFKSRLIYTKHRFHAK